MSKRSFFTIPILTAFLFFMFFGTALAEDFGYNLWWLGRASSEYVGSTLDFVKNSCGSNTIRVWGFEDAFGLNGAESLEKVLNGAESKGLKTIVSLVDYTSTIAPYGPTAWYSQGYKDTGYRSYAESVVNRFKGRVFIWEIANEPVCENSQSCFDSMYAFMDDMSSLIKSIDSSALISPGMKALGDAGDNPPGGLYRIITELPNIGANSCHYYDAGANNCFSAKSEVTSLGKYFYVGEAGVKAINEGMDCVTNACTYSCSESELLARESLLNQDRSSISADGFIVWQYSPLQGGGDNYYCDPFSVMPGDPLCGGGGSAPGGGDIPPNPDGTCPVGYNPVYGNGVDPSTIPDPNLIPRDFDYCGVNYYPQAYGWSMWDYWDSPNTAWSPDSAKVSMQKELGYAKEMGINLVRFFVHYEKFGSGSPAVSDIARLKEAISIASSHGIKSAVSLLDGPNPQCIDNLGDFGVGLEYKNHVRILIEGVELDPAVASNVAFWEFKNEYNNNGNCAGYPAGNDQIRQTRNMLGFYRNIKNMAITNKPFALAISSNDYINIARTIAEEGVGVIDILAPHFYAGVQGEIQTVLNQLDDTPNTIKVFLEEFGKSNYVLPGEDQQNGFRRQVNYYSSNLTTLNDFWQDDPNGFRSRFIGTAPWMLMGITWPPLGGDEAGLGIVFPKGPIFTPAASLYSSYCGRPVEPNTKPVTASEVIACAPAGSSTPVVCSNKTKGLGVIEMTDLSLWADPEYKNTLSDLGVKVVTATVNWDIIETSPGVYDRAYLDVLANNVRILNDLNIESIFLFVGVPLPYRSDSSDNGSFEKSYESNYRASVNYLVSYLHNLGVRKWRFWNEPDEWRSSEISNVSAYRYLYKIFYDEAHKVAGDIQIAPNAGDGNWLLDVISDSTVKYEALSVHPYGGDSGSCPYIDTQELQNVGRYGKVWITEYGWDVNRVTEAGQAERLKYAMSWINSQPYIEHAAFFKLNDNYDVVYGLIEGKNGFDPSLRRPAYYVYKDGSCDYYCDSSIVAGTCENPQNDFMEETCERVDLDVNVAMGFFPNSWDSKDCDKSTVFIGGFPVDSFDCVFTNVKYFFDFPAPQEFSNTFAYKLDKNNTEEYKDYFYWSGDTDPKAQAVEAGGAIPAGTNSFAENYDTSTNSYNGVTWGLIHYWSNPKSVAAINNQNYNDIKETKHIILLPTNRVDVLNRASGSDFWVQPATAAALGGARLESNFGRGFSFFWGKSACSVAGRPGDFYCANTEIDDFNLWAKAEESFLSQFAFEDKVIKDKSLSYCGGNILNTVNKSADYEQDLNVNAHLASSDLISVSLPAADPGVGFQGFLPELNSARNPQVVGCFADENTATPLTCPYSYNSGTYEMTNKNILRLHGRWIQSETCKTSQLGNEPSEPDCIVSPAIFLEQRTLTSTLPRNKYYTGDMVFEGIFKSPKIEFEPLVGKGEYNTMGMGVVTARDADNRTVIDGRTQECKYLYALASVSKPGESQQPNDFDSRCTTVVEESFPEEPELNLCEENLLEWNNNNSIKTSGDDSVTSLTFNTADLITIKGFIRTVDPLSKVLTFSACPTGGCNENNGPNTYKIKVKYNGKEAEFNSTIKNQNASVIYNLRVPRGASFKIMAGDENKVCYSFNDSGDRIAEGADLCLSGYVFPTYHAGAQDDGDLVCGIEPICDRERKCAEFASLSSGDFLDPRCQDTIHDARNECGSFTGGEFGVPDSGNIYACVEDAKTSWLGGFPLSWQQKASGFCSGLDVNNAIKWEDVVLEDVDCSYDGTKCLAVGRTRADVGNEGVFFKSVDGGNTWTAKKYNRLLSRVKFENNNTAYITGDNAGYIERIVFNGDSTITFQTQDVNNAPGTLFVGIDFESGTPAYLGGGGQNTNVWIKQPSEYAWTKENTGIWPGGINTVYDLLIQKDSALGEDHYVFGSMSVWSIIRKSPNGNWQVLNQAARVSGCGGKRLNRIRKSSNGLIVVSGVQTGEAGDSGCILRSTDLGASWNKAYGSLAKDLRGLDANGSGSVLIATGEGGVVFKSIDGGAVWAQKNNGIPATADLWGVKMIGGDEYNMIAVGSGSKKSNLIFKSMDGGESWESVFTISQEF